MRHGRQPRALPEVHDRDSMTRHPDLRGTGYNWIGTRLASDQWDGYLYVLRRLQAQTQGLQDIQQLNTYTLVCCTYLVFQELR